MVQEQVLDEIKDPSLRVYVIWEPILGRDSERTSRAAATLIPGPRAVQFWSGSSAVGKLFQAPIHLTGETAWDVYLLYARGQRWEASVPKPRFFMHQLSGRLPERQRLDGTVLAKQVQALLRD